MKKLSAVVIAKNAQETISNTLESLQFVDECIVIDGGSTDNTVEIARKNNCTIFIHTSNNFSDMRNFGLTKAQGEWILYVDSDEVVTDALQKEILKVISQTPVYSAFFLLRQNYYFGKYKWPNQEKLERLFRKSDLLEWKGKIHESPVVKGSVGQLSSLLLHYTHRDLESMLNKTIVWSEIEAELRIKNNHPRMTWWRFLRVMITGFCDSYIYKGGWKAGTMGLIESIYQSFSLFVTYARLWEKQQKKHE